MGLCDESELVLVVPGFTEPVFFEFAAQWIQIFPQIFV